MVLFFTGESGVVYRGYFNTGEGKELVAIKTCKRTFYDCSLGYTNCMCSVSEYTKKVTHSV